MLMLATVTRRVLPSLLLRRAVTTYTSPEILSHLTTPTATPPSVILIDVRPELEITDVTAYNSGRSLPAYLNLSQRASADDVMKYVPLENILSRDDDNWLDSTPEEFEAEYNFPHPLSSPSASNTTYIFVCKAGVRSKLAAELAEAVGVKNCGNYVGGAMEWENFMMDPLR
jgi:rhodanese-related sulfurtransferase